MCVLVSHVHGGFTSAGFTRSGFTSAGSTNAGSTRAGLYARGIPVFQHLPILLRFYLSKKDPIIAELLPLSQSWGQKRWTGCPLSVYKSAQAVQGLSKQRFVSAGNANKTLYHACLQTRSLPRSIASQLGKDDG